MPNINRSQADKSKDLLLLVILYHCKLNIWGPSSVLILLVGQNNQQNKCTVQSVISCCYLQPYPICI